MYIKGITDYNREGEARETGLFAGRVSQDGELRATQGGKQYGAASVRAFNRKDGTAAFITIKTFSDTDTPRIAALRKGDRILCAGVVETREYNGKHYTDMLVDLLLTPSDVAANRAALERRMESAGYDTGYGDSGFAEIGEEDGELPF